MQDNFPLMRSMPTVKPIIVNRETVSREDSTISAMKDLLLFSSVVEARSFAAFTHTHTAERTVLSTR